MYTFPSNPLHFGADMEALGIKVLQKVNMLVYLLYHDHSDWHRTEFHPLEVAHLQLLNGFVRQI